LYYQAVDIDLAGLGLRTPEPPETLSSSIPPLQRSPILQTPILPPGLDLSTSPDGELEVNQLTPPIPPPPISIPQPPHAPSDKPTLVLSPVTIPTPQVNDTPVQSTPTPMTPTGFGTKIINTIRRAPSMSAARGTIANLTNPSVNGSDARRSTTERSSRPSTSTSFVGSSSGSTQDQPPPLPPLPPNISNTSQSPMISSPMPVPQVSEPEKEGKEFKSKSPGLWFKKRRSLKPSEKVRPSSSPPADLPSSPLLHEEPHHSHTSWFQPSSSGSRAPKPQRRPSQNGGISTSEVVGLHPNSSKPKNPVPVAKYEDDLGHSGGSACSSPSSHSLLHNTQVSTGSAGRPSTSASSTGSGAHLESSPARKSSLAPSSAEWTRSSFDRKKSLDMKTISSPAPATLSSPLFYTQARTSLNRDLPLLPSAPNFKSHRSNISNGHILVSEPESTLKGKSRSSEHDNRAPSQTVSAGGIPVPVRSATLAPPTSLATSVGTNYSSSSTNSAGSNVKRATRKLSLTAPMLGFGKRDKDKEKERDRVQREKSSTPPNAFNGNSFIRF
jgi:ubiquitin carboxyl-terminal hydrolase 9/13